MNRKNTAAGYTVWLRKEISGSVCKPCRLQSVSLTLDES